MKAIAFIFTLFRFNFTGNRFGGAAHTLFRNCAHQVASVKLLLFTRAPLASSCDHAQSNALAPAPGWCSRCSPTLPLLLCEGINEDAHDACCEHDLNHCCVEEGDCKAR